MIFKRGCLPAVHNRRTMRTALALASVLNELEPPPDASNDYISAITVPWGMYGNDTLGDCVAADTAHTLMLRSANAASIVIPDEPSVIALYSAVGGYVVGHADTDNGCDENTMCDFLRTVGFMGHKANATCSIEPTTLDHLRWCIQLFGSCRIGLNLPRYAEDLFIAGKPWDVQTNGNQQQDGHDVPLVDYRNGTFTAISWGQPVIVTPAFLLAYCSEAHCELYYDWIKTQGLAPSGFNLTDLAAKMSLIT